MKRKALLLLLLVILGISMIFLTSCLEGLTPPVNDDDDDEPSESDDSGNAIINVRYMYDEYGAGSPKEIHVQKIDKTVGFTEDDIKLKDNLLYKGYGFCGYYADQSMKEVFDFTQELTEDTRVYCKRDRLEAGRDVKWEAVNITDSTVELVFRGTGDMYDFTAYEVVPWNIYKSNVVKVTIDEGITSVAGCAFYGFSNIKTVDLPSSITRIGDNSFYQSSISYINFPKGLLEIGESAFSNCQGLTELYFNKGLKSIKNAAFRKCTNIETIVLTDSIMSVGSSAFQECKNIKTSYYYGTEEEFGKIISKIDNAWLNALAFKYWYSPNEPTEPGPFWTLKVDEDSFRGIEDIHKWYYTIWYINKDRDAEPIEMDFIARDEVSGKYLATSKNVQFLNSIFDEKGGYRFASWKRYDNNETFTLTAGMEFLSDLKLYGDRGQICGDNLSYHINSRNKTLYIERTDVSNPDGRMWDFKEERGANWYGKIYDKVVFGSGVTYIGSNAFNECYDTERPYDRLSYIEIPTSVTQIHQDAINNCTGLLYIYYQGTDANQCTGLLALEGETSATVYVNADSVSDVSTLGAGAYYRTVSGRRIAWVYDDVSKVLYVGADHSRYHTIPDFVSISDAPWYSYRNDVKKVVVRPNVEKIGANTFYNMAGVESITVYERITSISETAFLGTGYYSRSMLENGYVYLLCNNGKHGYLVKVSNPAAEGSLFVIPSYTYAIAQNAFEGCSNISSLVFRKDIKPAGIYDGALDGLTSLEYLFVETSQSNFSKYSDVGFLNNIKAQDKIYYYSASRPNFDSMAEGQSRNYWYWRDAVAQTEPLIHEEIQQ